MDLATTSRSKNKFKRCGPPKSFRTLQRQSLFMYPPSRLPYGYSPHSFTQVIILKPYHPTHSHHEQLTHPTRSTIQLRTYRANFPDSDPSSVVVKDRKTSNSKTLTTIAYSQPFPIGSNVASSKIPRDDVMYLFLDERRVIIKPTLNLSSSSSSSTLMAKGNRIEGSNVNETEGDTSNGTAIEVDGFEIVDPTVKNSSSNSKSIDKVVNASSSSQLQLDTQSGVGVKSESSKEGGTGGAEEGHTDTNGRIGDASVGGKIYRTMALRPAASVVPLLQTLLSGFVLGMTKSARAVGSPFLLRLTVILLLSSKININDSPTDSSITTKCSPCPTIPLPATTNVLSPNTHNVKLSSLKANRSNV